MNEWFQLDNPFCTLLNAGRGDGVEDMETDHSEPG
jgi:hypothetical protein